MLHEKGLKSCRQSTTTNYCKTSHSHLVYKSQCKWYEKPFLTVVTTYHLTFLRKSIVNKNTSQTISLLILLCGFLLFFIGKQKSSLFRKCLGDEAGICHYWKTSVVRSFPSAKQVTVAIACNPQLTTPSDISDVLPVAWIYKSIIANKIMFYDCFNFGYVFIGEVCYIKCVIPCSNETVHYIGGKLLLHQTG